MVFATKEELEYHKDKVHYLKGKNANNLLGVSVDGDVVDEDGNILKRAGGTRKIILKDSFGIDFADVFQKLDKDNINILEKRVSDSRIDYRYFIIAAGQKATTTGLKMEGNFFSNFF